jgi:hypothetical protein
MKIHVMLIAICAALVLLNSGASDTTTHPDEGPVYRVGSRLKSDSNDLQIFIATGSLENPMVTLADNDGYPVVKDYYARAVTWHHRKGISVTFRFDGPATGREMALNVMQKGMTNHYQVMAMD